jgi:hypothetical protein
MNEDNLKTIVALLLVVSIVISVAGTMMVFDRASGPAKVVQVPAGNSKGTLSFIIGEDTDPASEPGQDIGTGNLMLTII